MNITLWILQGFLAVLFLVFGYMRVIKSKDELKEIGGEKCNGWTIFQTAILS